MKLILKLCSEGVPIHKACEQYDLDNWTFSRIIQQHKAWRKLYAEALNRQTEKLKDIATTCAMKSADDPRYLRILEFTLKMREGYFKRREQQVIVQASTQAPVIDRKVIYEEIATSDRKPPIKVQQIADPDEVDDDITVT